MTELSLTQKTDGNAAVFQIAGTISAPIRTVWEVMSDTDRINQVVYETPAFEIVSKDAWKTVGRVKVAGFEFEHEEHPWVWAAPDGYKNVRRMLSGPVERLVTTCELVNVTTNAGDETRVRYEVALHTKSGPLGFAAEKVLSLKIMSGVRALKEILEHVDGPKPIVWRNPDRNALLSKMKPFLAPLGELAEKLAEHIADAPDDVVNRMRPYELAEKWSCSREDALTLCLAAAQNGLLELRWDAVCSSCNGAVHADAHLASMPNAVSCRSCDRTFDVGYQSHIEAVFMPSAAIRPSKGAPFCLGNPKHTPHWVAQLVLEPGESHPVKLTLGSGAYFVQSPGIKERTLIDVGASGESSVRVHLEGVRGGHPPALPRATPVVRSGLVTIQLKNEDDKPRRIQIANDSLADLSATAAHVLASSSWKALEARHA